MPETKGGYRGLSRKIARGLGGKKTEDSVPRTVQYKGQSYKAPQSAFFPPGKAGLAGAAARRLNRPRTTPEPKEGDKNFRGTIHGNQVIGVRGMKSGRRRLISGRDLIPLDKRYQR